MATQITIHKNNLQNPIIQMLKTVFHIIGMLLVMESLFMFICVIPSLLNNQTRGSLYMTIGAGITLITGLLLWLIFHQKQLQIDKRCGFLIVTLIWIVFSFFGCLPAYLGGYIPSLIDAYFETMSGFTTTGSSIMNDVESLPYSIGLWRIMTQWIGGIGIVVIMLSIIPFVGGGGMALFSAEVAGVNKNKIAPQMKQTAKILLIVYISLTIIYFTTYFLLGMNLFDAVCHSFTTVATAGLSSKNTSAMAFNDNIQFAMSCFMFLSGTNLLFIYMIIKGKFVSVFKSEELKIYYIVFFIAIISIFLINSSVNTNIYDNLKNSLFMTASILTSTGLINNHIDLWPSSSILILILLMTTGAMSGSTTGGLKLIRMIVLFKNAKNTISRGLHSNAFIPLTIDKKIVNDNTLFNVFQIFLLFIITLVAGSLIFVGCGISMEESFVASLTSICNMGPGYNQSCYGNFAHFPQFAKIVMSFLMCIGRLELVTVFCIFTKSFWKK